MLWAIQQTIYTALTGDAVLMGKVAGVFDAVPQGDPLPYVVIGDGEAREWDTDLDTGFDANVVIHVWDSVHRGRRSVKQIQDDIYRILHRAELTVAGGHVVGSMQELADSFRDDDGLSWHGVQRFRLLVEEE